MTDYYRQPHQTQYGTQSAYTRKNGCGWSAGANGIGATTGGKIRPTPDQLHTYLKRSEETSPATPGWSMPDLEKATRRYGVECRNRTNAGFVGAFGWAGIRKAWRWGRYVVIQGDSDRFGSNTCSASFKGNHAIGVSPMTRVVNGKTQHWINDSVCKVGRWEYDAIIYSYARKLAGPGGTLRWGAFLKAVPKV